MQLSKDELDFIRKVNGAKFSIKSPAVIDLAVSSLFKPAFQSHALQVGNEVVVSCLSNPVVVDSLVRHGLIPIFVDICFPTYQILLDEVEEAINPDKCGAIFLPHIWGNPFNLQEMRDLANEYGIWLLSEGVVGAESDSVAVGSLEDISIFINDGALTCSSQMVYETIKSSHLYQYWGKISKLSQTATGSVDVSDIEVLDEYFSGHGHFEFPGSFANSVPSWTHYPITLKKSCPFSRTDYISKLDSSWFELPVTAWYEFRDKKIQAEKMYGIDAVMSNTVLLNPTFAYEIIASTKKFLESRNGK